MADKQVMTRSEYEARMRELYELEHEVREAIGQRLQTARDFGDLSENSEYDDARREQDENERRIAELRNALANVEVIDLNELDERDLRVSVGTEATLRGENGKTRVFRLVGTTETNSLSNRISNESPAGEALIGHAIGDTISFMLPSGKMATYVITNIAIAKDVEDDSGK